MSQLALETKAYPGETTERPAEMGMHAHRPVPRISIQAFCETDAIARQVRRAFDDRRMAKTHPQVHMGGVEAAVELFQTVATPNLILLESSAVPRDMLQNLAALSEV